MTTRDVPVNSAEEMARSLDDLPRTLTPLATPKPDDPSHYAPAVGWRIVRGDFDDLKKIPHAIYNTDPSSFEYQVLVYHSVTMCHRKNSRSPFITVFKNQKDARARIILIG